MVASAAAAYSFTEYHAPGDAVRRRRDMRPDNKSSMSRSSNLRAIRVVAALAGAALAACRGPSAAMFASTTAGSGTMAVQLTDAPFTTDSVKSVDVFVIRVDARVADADSSNAAKGATDDSASTGGWTTLNAPNASVNLLAFQNGVAMILGSKTVPAGTYLGFRLIIDPTRSSITLTNGTVLSGTSAPSIMFPSASRSGIKIVLKQPVTVTTDQTTTVLVDFMVGSSFVMRGNSISENGLLFTPVVHASVK
jgi:hypothetical protein